MTTSTSTAQARTFYGKYRGTVINNVDPMMRGRLLLEVPDVVGFTPSSWAEPCVPLAGPSGPPMGVYMVPPIGAGVWVEFEQGDPSKPIWVGCRWGLPTDIPPLALLGLPISPNICLQTAGQNDADAQRHAADAGDRRHHAEESHRRHRWWSTTSASSFRTARAPR